MRNIKSCSGVFHPATFIFLWILFVFSVAHLPFAYLALFSAILFCVTLYYPFLLWRLLKRSKILFLSTLLIYAYSGNGRYLYPSLGWASPSIEGLYAGLYYILHLWCIVSSLLLLRQYLDAGAWLRGMLGLLQPLAWSGLPVQRLAVRLCLTLHYAERLLMQFRLTPTNVVAQLSQQLAYIPAADDHDAALLALHAPHWSRVERLFCLGLLIGWWQWH
jgi:energy-coupling factor transporter transmembrane protein EcfT